MKYTKFLSLDIRTAPSFLELDIRKEDRGDRLFPASLFLPNGKTMGLYDYNDALSLDIRDIVCGMGKHLVEMPDAPKHSAVSFIDGGTVVSAIRVDLIDNERIVATFPNDTYSGKEALFLYKLGEYEGETTVNTVPPTFIQIGSSNVSGDTATLEAEIGSVGYIAVIIYI